MWATSRYIDADVLRREASKEGEGGNMKHRMRMAQCYNNDSSLHSASIKSTNGMIQGGEDDEEVPRGWEVGQAKGDSAHSLLLKARS